MERWVERFAKICILVGGLFFVIYIYGLLKSDYFILGEIQDKDIERTGQIGDFFGGIVGSIWALAGVLLYFSALKLQRKEIKNQIDEMIANKKLMSQQQFESTFFGLLTTQQEIGNNVKGTFHTVEKEGTSYKFTSQEYSSNDFFLRMILEINHLYNVYRRGEYSKWETEYIDAQLEQHYASFPIEDYSYSYATLAIYDEKIRKMYNHLNLDYLTWVYNVKSETVRLAQNETTEEMMCQCVYGHIYVKYQNSLGHYCRHLYNIVKFLDREKQNCLDDVKSQCASQYKELEISKINSRFEGYIAFVHSMLSSSELFILFYNSLLFPKAKKIYADYHLFDNLLQENLIKKEHANLIDRATLKTEQDIFSKIIEKIHSVQINK